MTRSQRKREELLETSRYKYCFRLVASSRYGEFVSSIRTCGQTMARKIRNKQGKTQQQGR